MRLARALVLFLLLLSVGCAQGQFGLSRGGTAAAIGAESLVINQSSTGWKAVCTYPSCGGVGTIAPSATSQTYGTPSPSLDGSAMHLTETTTSSASDTDVLWTWLASTICDTCTNLVSDFWVEPAENANLVGNYEMDTFLFDKTDGLDFMYGVQCNQTIGQWQYANQSSSWSNMGVACSLPASAWHHIVLGFSRVVGDASCSGMPCQHWNFITVDGTTTKLSITMPATTLNSTWSSAIGHQFQIDSTGSGASSSTPLTTGLYVDEETFVATH